MSDKLGQPAPQMWTIDATPRGAAPDAAKLGGFGAVELRRTERGGACVVDCPHPHHRRGASGAAS
jgi:hypothetical protein